MSWKDKIENHLGLIIVGLMATSGASGWKAHSYFLGESGQVVLEKSEVERLKLYAKLGREELVSRNMSLEKKVHQLETKLVTEQLVSSDEATSPLIFSNVKFKPLVGSKVKVGEAIEVTFDYSFKEGVEANIWAFSTDLPVEYSPSKIYSQQGSLKRNFSAKETGWVRTVDIIARTQGGQVIKQLSIPAAFEVVKG